MHQDGPDVTGLLVAWSNGDEAARSRLIEAVYAELRRLARGYLQRERPDHSLPPTALVHEAYLKLVDQRQGPLAEPHAVLCDRRAPDAPDPGRSRTIA